MEETQISTKNQQAPPANSDIVCVRGAKTNNLRGIDIDIPRNEMVVITGRSGSGKSSLAFDTLFNEGQRQFFESQPFSARQFFKQLPEANVDSISGLPPTLCLDQTPSSPNPRSTVGTLTEIYDYLRLLMARAGQVHCYQCDAPIQQQSPEQICESIMRLPESTRLMLLAPLVTERRGAHAAAIETVRRERLVRARVNGQIHDIDQLQPLPEELTHSIEAVTDRLIIKPGIEDRLLKAIESSVKMSGGSVIASWLTPERSTPETKSDVSSWEEKLFSTRYACLACDINYAEVEPRSFSFNSPLGACSVCNGLGFAIHFDPNQVIPDREVSLLDYAIAPWSELPKSAYRKKIKPLEPLIEQLDWSVDAPMTQMQDAQWDKFLYNADRTAPGLMLLLERELSTTDDDDWCYRLIDMETRLTCSHCRGSRLNRLGNSVRLGGRNMEHLLALPLDQAHLFFSTLELQPEFSEIADPILKTINHRLSFLVGVGIPYLTLGRAADTLSGGEYQRARLGTSIGTGLTGVCYILDEPSIGLHARDGQRLIDSIIQLRDRGNSMLVVEHDEAVIRAADHLIEIGPGAGRDGGRLTAQGSVDELIAASDSLTSQFLSGQKRIQRPKKRRKNDPENTVSIKGASGFNLKNVDVEIPLGVLNCVTGVSGSGKSTLINQTLVPAVRRHLELVSLPPSPHERIEGLQQIDSLVFVDQKPIGRSAKSCPATFTGVFDEFRKIFAATRVAKQRGYTLSRFSFNSKAGRCANCHGHGHQKVKLDFLPDIFVRCEVCSGRRFDPLTLQAKFGEFSIADVLEMTISEALKQFSGFQRIARILQCLDDVGLGYLQLGQSATSLSGGEAQRIKLARELSVPREGHTVYVLDEPTTGLHFADIDALLTVLHQITDQGNTMIVIEHNLDVVANADWVIDLGPEGGEEGGHVVAVGPPEAIAAAPNSLTGQCLSEMLT